MKQKVAELLSSPWRDFLSAMDASSRRSPPLSIIIVFFCLLISWWIYVPTHELLHALGCMIGGGRVSRLEISPVYGAAFLRHFFPFISVGSEYAGQLTGFDTFGSDSTYFLTDFFPYLLTIILGVPLLKSAFSKTAPFPFNSIKLGIAIPIAYAPFVSVTGDYYEMGSIVISRLTVWAFPGFKPFYWRSDDALKLARQLFFSVQAPDIRDVIGLSTAFLLAIALAFGTYGLGVFWSRLLLGRITAKTL